MSSFAVRTSGYTPNVCRDCERRSSAERRKKAYADVDKRTVIQQQNAAWRSNNSAKFTKARNNVVPNSARSKSVLDWERKFIDQNEIIAWVRSGGFLPSTERIESINYRLQRVIMQEPLPQLHVGLSYLDHVNPHRYDAITESKLSLRQAFMDDAEIIKVVKYILSTNRVPTKDLILRNLKFNVRMPSHFYPSAAVALVNSYSNGGDVIDPFVGWGGRLLGTLCSNAQSYCGTDTQQLSVLGAACIAQDFAYLSSVQSHVVCADFSEFLQQTDRRFDLLITSPPFFDTEDYGIGKSRGREWIAKVAKPLVDGTKRVLKPEGIAAIHVQDRPRVPVLSVIMASFLNAGFGLHAEHKYGRRPGQSILVFRRQG